MLAVAASVAAALSLAGVFSGSSTEGPFLLTAGSPDLGVQEPLSRLLDGFSTGDTAAFVRELELRLEENPYDADALTLLGLAYQQLARETGRSELFTRFLSALSKRRCLAGRMRRSSPPASLPWRARGTSSRLSLSSLKKRSS